MIEVNVRKARWIPEYGEDRELDWLAQHGRLDDLQEALLGAGAADLRAATTRCGWFDVIGGREELKERAVEGWEEFEGPHARTGPASTR